MFRELLERSEALEAYSFLARKESFTSFRVACRKRISAMSSNFLMLHAAGHTPRPRFRRCDSSSKSADVDPKLILPSDDEPRIFCVHNTLSETPTRSTTPDSSSHTVSSAARMNSPPSSTPREPRFLKPSAPSYSPSRFPSLSASFSVLSRKVLTNRDANSRACNKTSLSNRFVVFSHSKIVRCNFIMIGSSSVLSREP